MIDVFDRDPAQMMLALGLGREYFSHLSSRFSAFTADFLTAQENPTFTRTFRAARPSAGVTSFFRDPPAWEQLKDEVIPALLAAQPKGGVLRAWASGCSTGEEAYSLARVFKEALERVKPAGNFSLQVFATDLDRDAIDRARAGVLTVPGPPVLWRAGLAGQRCAGPQTEMPLR
jgi:chemotaxis methyl-accepting protein methylase